MMRSRKEAVGCSTKEMAAMEGAGVLWWNRKGLGSMGVCGGRLEEWCRQGLSREKVLPWALGLAMGVVG